MSHSFNVMFFQLSIYMIIMVNILAIPSKEAELERRMMGGMGSMMGGMGGGGSGGSGGMGGLGGMMGGGGSGGVGGMGGLGAMMGGGGGGAVDNSGGGGCKKYKIISARGTGEPQATPIGYRKYISSVLAAVPDGGNYEVKYPASVDYMSGPGQGAADALKYITSQQSSCPKQLYVFIGYSEGAMVVTQLAAKPSIPTSSVAAIVMYGNPYFKGGAPQNACSAKSGAGIAAMTGITLPAKFAPVTFDCCVTGDMICQTSGSMMPHLGYGGSASEKAAIDFTVGKLKGAKPGSADSSASTPAAGADSGAASGSGGGLGGMLGGLGGGGSSGGGGMSSLMGGLGGGGSGGGMSGLMGGLGGGGAGGSSGMGSMMGGLGGGGMGGGSGGGLSALMGGAGGSGGGGGLSALMGGAGKKS
ncbi:cutinase [Melampsora larici-populina 98AG31]|uniref:Cutinase n=1 Tax=Melampsora larici-populina (strain 98AG31 / pathotype 3-4-7) TaxID=747676 RepID=F4S751_MELLP|nr:cutinase [Melampsora larici-populina 98AG31]EGF99528.1 cutinase [Melampsora larici-populina 98AG31]